MQNVNIILDPVWRKKWLEKAARHQLMWQTAISVPAVITANVPLMYWGNGYRINWGYELRIIRINWKEHRGLLEAYEHVNRVEAHIGRLTSELLLPVDILFFKKSGADAFFTIKLKIDDDGVVTEFTVQA